MRKLSIDVRRLQPAQKETQCYKISFRDKCIVLMLQVEIKIPSIRTALHLQNPSHSEISPKGTKTLC
jgi:hypothetical protein